jgi:hypothetical protein
VAKPAEDGGKSGEFGPRPIFEIADERCPKCGEVLPANAVVCMKCGYDQRANVVREVETGVVEVPVATDESKGPAKEEFVTPGRLSPKVLTITGGALTMAALVSAGVFGPRGSFWLVTGWVLLTLYTIAVNTATGVAAVAVAAKVNSQLFGRLDVAAARMFAAFALFQAIASTRLPLGYSIFTNGVPFVVGAALYFGAIMLLFKKDRQTATLIAMAHFILWILLQLGPALAGWVSIAGQGIKPAGA